MIFPVGHLAALLAKKPAILGHLVHCRLLATSFSASQRLLNVNNIKDRLLTFSVCSSPSKSLFCLNHHGFHTLLCCHDSNNSISSLASSPKRLKYKGTSADDDESDDEGDDSDDEHFFKEDEDLPNNFKDITAHLKSLRVDAVVAQGLNIARNKVDDHFLGSNLELNGSRVLKKGKQMSEGDFVDVITAKDEGTKKFKRVRLVHIASKATKSERKTVKLRVWRANVTVKGD